MEKDTKVKNLADFNPNFNGIEANGLFGLPFEEQDATLVLIPVPWEVTVSFKAGTANTPTHILEASQQIDLYHSRYTQAWRKGIYMLPENPSTSEKNKRLRPKAVEVISALEEGKEVRNAHYQNLYTTINDGCTEMVEEVYRMAQKLLHSGKKVGLLGGDHSTPLGILKAMSQKYDAFGILQIDAHLDLRIAYEGFTYSHASIMHHALEMPQVKKLVSVGIRDFCDDEAQRVKDSSERITVFEDEALRFQQFEGVKFATQAAAIINQLPDKVYVTVDIDGLSPDLCPQTGTPVPGGLSFQELKYLLWMLKKSGKEIIGFDLCESSGTSADDINANTAMRILYELCCMHLA